jgi:hypothetical protein
MRDKARLLWFLFRNMVKQTYKGEFHEAREACYLIRMTLSYKTKRIK